VVDRLEGSGELAAGVGLVARAHERARGRPRRAELGLAHARDQHRALVDHALHVVGWHREIVGVGDHP
jgi:hypothetical protein